MRRALSIDKNTFGPSISCGQRPGPPGGDAGPVGRLGAGRRAPCPRQAGAHLAATPRTTTGRSDEGDAEAASQRCASMPTPSIARPQSAAARAEGFELAQWALQTDAAEALAQMSARFAKGDGPLAGLVREREGLLARGRDEDKRMLEAVGRDDRRLSRRCMPPRRRSREPREHRRELTAKFPEYAELASPKPLPSPSKRCYPDEALILFLDGPQLGSCAPGGNARVVRHQDRGRLAPHPHGHPRLGRPRHGAPLRARRRRSGTGPRARRMPRLVERIGLRGISTAKASSELPLTLPAPTPLQGAARPGTALSRASTC